MAAWVQCGSCGLRHSSREDGLCPRCRAPADGRAAGSATATALPAPAPPAPPAPQPSAPAAAGVGFDAARDAFRAPPRRRTLLWLGIASAVAFVAIAVLHVSLPVAVLLAAVLLVHELGHWVAMRLSGQQDVRIFFIPLFGAVTTARSAPTSAGARAAIALAGPVPGIVAGVLLARLLPAPGLGRGLAVMLLYLNVFNLLPIGFLDGGKVVSTLFLARLPAVEGAFAVASAIPLGLAFTGRGSSGSGIVGGLVVGTAFAAIRRYRVAQEARQVEATLAGQRDPLGLSDEALRALYEAATRVAAKDKRVKGAGQVAAVMREVLEAAAAPRPTPAEQVGYGFAWAAALAVGWASLAATGVRLLS